MKNLINTFAVISLLLINLISPATSESQNIISASGSFINGKEIEISGSGFGAKSHPYPLISSYDNSVKENNFSTGSISSAWWMQNTGDDPVLVNSSPRTSHYQSSYKISYDAAGPYSVIGYNYGSRSDVTYASWWSYRDYSTIHGTTGSGDNCKYCRLYTSSGDGNGLILSLLLDGSTGLYRYTYAAPEYAPSSVGWELAYTATGATVNALKYFKIRYDGDDETLKNWDHYELYQIYSAVLEDTGSTSVLLKNGQTVYRAIHVSLQKAESNDDQRNLRLGQVSGGRTETQMEYIDQIYYDNTVAHVFISDAGNLTSFTDVAQKNHREIQVCSSWSDQSIKFTLNQGAFPNGSTAYIYVVNASGEISNGYKILFGGSSSKPPAPSLKRIEN